MTENLLIPDDTKTIRNLAIAAWPPAWQGKNLRGILVTLGYDIPWKNLPQKSRDWIIYTDETPSVPVYPGYTVEEARAAIANGEEASYMGTFASARRYVLHSFATTQSQITKKRVSQFIEI